MARRIAKRLRRAVRTGVKRWRRTRNRSAGGRGAAERPREEVHRSLERPPRLRVDWDGTTSPTQRSSESFKVGIWRVLGRFVIWSFAATCFLAGTFWDTIRRRNTVQRRAVRLRVTLERVSGTFVKLGQQASMRIDLFPYEYCQELEKMLDKVRPFPVAHAIKAIEHSTGAPLGTTFESFDPEPIGSGSVACVYQGVLCRDGSRVAVKVRRPGIGFTFEADVKALHILLRILELFLLPPGFTRHLVFELGSMLMEELNFSIEARYTELFRRDLKKAKFRFAVVPRVYHDLSDNEVLVTEFQLGIHLTEIIAAVEHGDQKALATLREQGIDPKLVARRMLRVIRFSAFEGLFFNADPHPANILVRPDNRLIFIDFGSCGAFTEQELHVWRRLLHSQAIGDVGHVGQAVLSLLEPLSHIDVDEFSRRLETILWKNLYAFKSKHAEWWERTSANLWVNVLQLVREYKMHMNLNTLRMIRATMLSDSLAARLDPDIDHYKEYRKYEKQADKRARKRLEKKICKSYERRWRMAEQIFDTTGTLIFKAQRFIDLPLISFAKMIGKAAETAVLAIQLGVLAGAVLFSMVSSWRLLDYHAALEGSWSGWEVIRDFVFGREYTDLQQALITLSFEKWWYQVAAILFTLVVIRRLLFRIGKVEI